VTDPPYTLEFYEDPEGHQPVRSWLRTALTSEERRTVGAAMRAILQAEGIGVCGTAFGRQLGGGLFEFRLRDEDLLVRIFCHAHGSRLILLLGGYDKGRDPSERRQNREIETARAGLEEWRSRQ
jgi:putative component of toxin-antitoxin plasmid stabilization module